MNDPAILSGATTTDRSSAFFSDIFGVGWEQILSGTAPAGDFGNVLVTMLSTINTVVLAGVMVLMFYVISSGVVGTAHEGEALGKRYSTLYTPIRGALSVSALMPLPWCKMSLIQALILKFIFFSISGASYLANITVDQIAKQGGSATLPAAPIISGVGLAEEILRNLVVQEYFYQQMEISYASPGYSQTTISDGGQTATKIDFYQPDLSSDNSFDGRMGELSISCSAANPSSCQGEVAAVIQLISALRPMAEELGKEYTGIGSSTDQLSASFHEAIKKYASSSQKSATAALQVINSEEKQQQLSDLVNSIKNNGWAWLGSYYIAMSKLNEDAHSVASARAGISRAVDLNSIASSAYKEFEGAVAATNNFLKTQSSGLSVGVANGTTPSDKLGVGSLLGSFFKDALQSSFPYVDGNTQISAAGIVSQTLKNGDPILSLQSLGHSLINFGSNLTMISATAGVGEWVTGLFDTPKQSNFSPKMSGLGVLKQVFSAVETLITPFVVPLISAGLVLAYYVPMMPFIFWSSAIVGWLILCMEVMVAAPIWAAAHAIPEGEGLAGQHGKQGYMLFLGILLRPSLHVVGFFLSFALSSTVAHFVADSYLAFNENSGLGESPSGAPAQMISWLATLTIGISLAIVLLHKCFSLITWLPDNILKWISGGVSSMDEHADHGRANTMIVAALRDAPAATTGGVGSIASKLPKLVKGGIGDSGQMPPSIGPSNQHISGDRVRSNERDD